MRGSGLSSSPNHSSRIWWKLDMSTWKKSPPSHSSGIWWKMDMSTSKFPRGCMDYPRQEDWPTTYSRSSFSPTDITSAHTLQACGDTSTIWCVSPYGWMTLVWSMEREKMLSTWWECWNHIMRWQMIGKAKCTVNLSSSGITISAPVNYLSPATLEECSSSSSTCTQQDHMVPLILQPPLNLERQRRKWPHWITPTSLTKKVSRGSNRTTELTSRWVEEVLDYVATHHDAKIKYHASDMQLVLVHKDSSYLNDHKAQSNCDWCFILGWYQPDNAPLQLNVCLLVAVGLLKIVALSVAESKLGGLFYNAPDGTILRLTLNEMGHPQSEATPIYVNSMTAVGNTNKSTKEQQSRAINMRYLGALLQPGQFIADRGTFLQTYSEDTNQATFQKVPASDNRTLPRKDGDNYESVLQVQQ